VGAAQAGLAFAHTGIAWRTVRWRKARTIQLPRTRRLAGADQLAVVVHEVTAEHEVGTRSTIAGPRGSRSAPHAALSDARVVTARPCRTERRPRATVRIVGNASHGL